MIGSLHVIGSHQFGGAERFFQRLVTALDRDPRHRPAAVLRPDSPLRNQLPQTVPVSLVGMRGGWDLLSRWQIRRLLGRSNDVVQTYMGRATKLTRVPAGSGVVQVARLGGYYKIDGYYRHADAWVGNTRGLCDYLVRQGLPAERVFFIGNFVAEAGGADADRQRELRQELGIPADALVMFSLGRLLDFKGFADLLEGFARLPEEWKGQPLVLMIAGEGPEEQILRATAHRLGIENRVVWAGWRSDPGPCFHAADLFVCPSRRETLGNVILEAWAHHLPVVSTRTAGGEELIETGKNGVLCPIEAPHQLAAALQQVLELGLSGRQQLAAAGVATLRGEFTEQAVVAAYTDLYRSLTRS